MVPLCALCQQSAACIYCVNDAAELCAACDAQVHNSNPLAARHERRPLTVLAECASAAQATSSDAAVVPQFHEVAQFQESQQQPAQQQQQMLAAGLPPRHLSVGDLLDWDLPSLEDLPGPGRAAPRISFDFAKRCSMDFAKRPSMEAKRGSFDFFARTMRPSFDMGLDGVVPSFDAAAPQPLEHSSSMNASSFFAATQHLANPLMHMGQEPARSTSFVPASMGGGLFMAPAQAKPAAAPPALAEDPIARQQRLARYREKRRRRQFGKTVRYRSRQLYAEQRPRVKGRFVSPEEYAAYVAEHGGAPAEEEEDEDEAAAMDHSSLRGEGEVHVVPCF